MRISDWSSDVCSSDLQSRAMRAQRLPKRLARRRLGLFRSPPPDAQRDVDESIVAMPVGNRIMVAANGTHAGGAKLEHAPRRGAIERRRTQRAHKIRRAASGERVG